jgi:hypothetical protein
MTSIFVHMPMSLMTRFLQVSIPKPMTFDLLRIIGKVQYVLQLISFSSHPNTLAKY